MQDTGLPKAIEADHPKGWQVGVRPYAALKLQNICYLRCSGWRKPGRSLEAVIAIKTALQIAEMLPLYHSIDVYVSCNFGEVTRGTGAIDEISSRLREELPGLRVG